MVRVWTPNIALGLDDNRLPAAHAETHYIMAALVRGRGYFWLHPETQRFYGREEELRYCHNQLADEMVKRGMNHATNLPGPALDPRTTDREDMEAWLIQDSVDLYTKWEGEGRLRDIGASPEVYFDVKMGSIILAKLGDQGSKILGHTKSGKPIIGFHPARASDTCRVIADTIANAGYGFYMQGHKTRVWKPADSKRLKHTVEDGKRGPSTDQAAIRNWLETHGDKTNTELFESIQTSLREQ